MKVSGVAGGKIEPGLNAFAESPRDAAIRILPLLSRVTEPVPREGHPRTRVFIKSTAGMRLLPEETQDAIYDEIYDYLLSHPGFPFTLRRGDLGTIDGDKEAFYAVLAANYLKGRIDARLHPTGHEAGPVSALDMGGASTQIIFRHPERIFVSGSEGVGKGGDVEGGVAWEEDGVITETHQVLAPQEAESKRGQETIGPVTEGGFWGVSHLGYGVSEVRSKVWSYLVDRHTESGGSVDMDVVNPCSFVDRVDFWKGHRLLGSGDLTLCEKMVSDVLWGRDDPEGEGRGGDGEWAERARGIGGVSMPEVSGDFLAMSVFFYAMHCLHELGPAELVGAHSRRGATGCRGVLRDGMGSAVGGSLGESFRRTLYKYLLGSRPPLRGGRVHDDSPPRRLRLPGTF
ncbi:unnamed protein product [Ascophyllum nodosum]